MILNESVVMITGASSGIGAAIARDLASGGARLVLAARREDRLAALAEEITAAGGTARYKATDVTIRADMQAVADLAVEAFGRVDVIVNNAGIMPLSMMENLRVDEWDRMIDVNVKGLLYGVAAVLPGMLERNRGHIINVSSVAGHVVFPSATVYCGTKFAVRAISEGLRHELAGRVRVTNISPGAIATELPDSIQDKNARQAIQPALDIAVPADSIARAVRFTIEQPDDVSVNEMVVRPTAQKL